MKEIKFIDLFAGIGGIRKGFEIACNELELSSKCVFTSEIKAHAIKVLEQNNPYDVIHGDITTIDSRDIPDFDFLLAGFPCQAFSSAGRRLGFADIRGTLFFEVERILREKRPFGFILENVEGLVNHDNGNTLATILQRIDDLGYRYDYKVLNSKDFGVPQERKRIYIVGTSEKKPNMSGFVKTDCRVGSILEHGLETSSSPFVKNLLKHYTLDELEGKSIKDKRGGGNNIHAWDLEIKGYVSNEEKILLDKMLTERRKKRWAVEYGIDWMDGMALSFDMIKTFYPHENLKEMLDSLVDKGYVKREYPKRKVKNHREQDPSLPLGYNIVSGKMTFEVNKVLDPNGYAPTLVAMDMKGIYVRDGQGIRNLSLREGLRLFGYPEDFKMDIEKSLGYDLLGNTVVVPVIKEVSKRVLLIYRESK